MDYHEFYEIKELYKVVKVCEQKEVLDALYHVSNKSIRSENHKPNI